MTDVHRDQNGNVQSNPEEEILKEVEETDWTEEIGQEEDDFDVGDLECVDEEEIDDRRRDDRRGRIRPASPQRSSRHRRQTENRFQPYGRDSRRTRDFERSKKKQSPGRMARDKRRMQEYHDKKKAEQTPSHSSVLDEFDIDELEEVDCCEYDEDEDTATSQTPSSSCPTATPDSTSVPGSNHNEPEEDDDPWVTGAQEDDASSQLDEDDFPSLCEEIDPELLRKVAEGQFTPPERATTCEMTAVPDRENVAKSQISEPSERHKTGNAGTEKITVDRKEHKRPSPRGSVDDRREEERRERRHRHGRTRKRSGEQRRGESFRSSSRETYCDGKPTSTHVQVGKETNGHASTSTVSNAAVAGNGHRQRSGSSREGNDHRRNGEKRVQSPMAKRRRDDDILPPSRTQIRSLLRQLDARNHGIRRESLERRRRASRERAVPSASAANHERDSRSSHSTPG